METATLTRKSEIDHARKVDNEVARLWSLFHEVNDEMHRIAKNIEQTASYASKPYNQGEQRQAQYAARIAGDEAKLNDLRPLREERRDAATQYNEEHYKGWNRFFHVVHIHNTMYCSSFRPTTKIGWLPDVSGLTAEEAVAAHGETLCTKCFPDAPVALTTKPVDESTCTGHAVQPMRTGYYRGNWATCSDCGERVTITSTGKLRKHKKA